MPALVLPVDTRSVAAARGFLRNMLSARGAGCTDDAVLMISELVANAVRHAHARLGVMASIAGEILRVEVADDDRAVPVAADPQDHATSGRGLGIVDSLADRWGVAPDTGGKVVWFELRLHPLIQG